VLQYQAREYYARFDRDWGLFEPMAAQPAQAHELPVPYLDAATRTSAVGSPAIAHESPGNYDVFSLGSDRRIWWKKYRRVQTVIAYVNGKPVLGWRDTVSAWQSIGCCFASEPSAVSRAPERIDVAAISTLGEVQRIKYVDGAWNAPLTLRGGAPSGGNRYAGNGRYVGPAIASRGADLLDVFVVRADGRLAVTTWRNGNWEAWQTLGALGAYTVTARPAAVGLADDFVQLAINESETRLFEPGVSFGAGAPAFALGVARGTVQRLAPPALTDHTGAPDNNRYRVLVTNASGRISIRGEVGAWRDIGGIPQPGTGPAAVGSGDETFLAVINGEDATSCRNPFCHPNAPSAGQVIQPGGLWIRRFN
jgi:hypothetical protein